MKSVSQTLQKLVSILNDLQVHSGPELSIVLGVSRNAVWKHIQQLIKYGIAVRAIQSRGYRLSEPLWLLDEDEIRQRLKDPNIPLCVLGSIASTNDYFNASRNAKMKKVGHLEVCLAEYQSAGRGRFCRRWEAPFGANILLSCRFLIQEALTRLSGLSLCVGLSVIHALQSCGIKEVSCKWPNDILHQGAKLAGILVEIQAETEGVAEAIIGIGCNVNMSSKQLTTILRPVTSLQYIVGSPQNRNKIAASLINSLSQYLQRFQQKGLADFLVEWRRQDALYGKPITLYTGHQSIQGIAQGIDGDGHLLVKLSSGDVKAYAAGEVSASFREIGT